MRRYRYCKLTKIAGCLLLLGGLNGLRAVDEQQLALATRAQSDFDRVQRATGLELPDATRCEQSEAAWLPVAPPSDLARVHFQKGYCTLVEAAITRRPDDFRKAAGEFEEALKAWPERAGKAARSRAPEPIPSGLRLLAPIARLEAAMGAAQDGTAGSRAADLEREGREIDSAVGRPLCPASLMPAAACQAWIDTGRLWLGWIALGQDDLVAAEREFSGLSDSGWPQLVSGNRAFRDRHYSEAAAQFAESVRIWARARQDSSASLAARLAPAPDQAQALADWGGAQLLAGDTTAAIGTLDAAVKAAPNPARALFLRARAEELAGRMEAALSDYNLAARTALAHAQDLASGESHLYRGILLYRRKDFAHAENEFASSLNFEIPLALRPDAVAWRHMAAVAGHACGSREPLEQSLAAVSPYFPKDEARALAASCPLTTSAVTGSAL